MKQQTPIKHTTLEDFPRRPARGMSLHLWAFSYLETEAAYCVVSDQIDNLYNAGKSNNTSATLRALNAAASSLRAQACTDARDAARYGELLFCWKGTRATEVPDRVAVVA